MGMAVGGCGNVRGNQCSEEASPVLTSLALQQDAQDLQDGRASPPPHTEAGVATGKGSPLGQGTRS